MQQAVLSKIRELSKTKKDGIYSNSGVKYLVKNGQAMFLCEGLSIYQLSYGFMIEIGKIKYGFEAAKKMKELSKLD